ncbi:hypothetical protein SELMODRAFT_445933 [Selaginella moellendorffii]|uniref:Uncharacterized protein n=1 Tax=Selaginella moellendorffii TaxID=88036 RepID=D8SME5_SELML|nr:uncharacterized protein LOC9644588 [Selaginella moellendorffii]EFJ14584.1 hypothetical protein SELMODRAFT_445933 [Selaginella moellendorffii]|eukprot:XP_002984534.1 uncharacterized protein LOC9644588 [Selaginella moellendorffii]
MAPPGDRSGLVRPIAKQSGSDWDDGVLRSFNIKVTKESSFRDFFGVNMPVEFSNPDVAELVSLDLQEYAFGKLKLSSIRSRYVKSLVKRVFAVTRTHQHEESAVDDMSLTLLELFQYDNDDTAVRSRTILDLFMSRGKKQAIPDVVVERLDTAVKMLVQEDKNYDGNLKGHHPEAQLIAEAIAAYQENSRLYERLSMGEYPDQQIIPGIVMLGTCPTFYLIPLTKALAEAVRQGEQPSFDTAVRKYALPMLPATVSDTMLFKSHCFHIAQCLEAFKRFV